MTAILKCWRQGRSGITMTTDANLPNGRQKKSCCEEPESSRGGDLLETNRMLRGDDGLVDTQLIKTITWVQSWPQFDCYVF